MHRWEYQKGIDAHGNTIGYWPTLSWVNTFISRLMTNYVVAKLGMTIQLRDRVQSSMSKKKEIVDHFSQGRGGGARHERGRRMEVGV